MIIHDPFKPLLAHAPIRHERVEKVVEIGAVIGMNEVGQLMR